jgi:hypothetical protein
MSDSGCMGGIQIKGFESTKEKMKVAELIRSDATGRHGEERLGVEWLKAPAQLDMILCWFSVKWSAGLPR